MTEDPFDSNLEVESPEPGDEQETPDAIMPPPLPTTGYETQVLVPEPEETPVVEEPVVVVTTPPAIPEPEPVKELDMPSPFEQEQPEPITVGESIDPVVIESSSDAPLPPPAASPAVEPPKKNNTTLIIIIVVVVVLLLCCCCAIIGGTALPWDDIMWELGLNLTQSLM